MEELLKMASIIPAILILFLGAAVLITAMQGLFLFVEIITCLTQRIRKLIAKHFEE